MLHEYHYNPHSCRQAVQFSSIETSTVMAVVPVMHGCSVAPSEGNLCTAALTLSLICWWKLEHLSNIVAHLLQTSSVHFRHIYAIDVLIIFWEDAHARLEERNGCGRLQPGNFFLKKIVDKCSRFCISYPIATLSAAAFASILSHLGINSINIL